MLDFRTFQDHAAPDTTSNLLFKGAVGGHSRSVYTGLIRVRKNARGTNAFQTNRNIKLSEARGPSRCPTSRSRTTTSTAATPPPSARSTRTSASTSRAGACRPQVAERLVVAGFFDEVLSRLPVPAAATALRNLVAGKLDRQVPVERRGPA